MFAIIFYYFYLKFFSRGSSSYSVPACESHFLWIKHAKQTTLFRNHFHRRCSNKRSERNWEQQIFRIISDDDEDDDDNECEDTFRHSERLPRPRLLYGCFVQRESPVCHRPKSHRNLAAETAGKQFITVLWEDEVLGRGKQRPDLCDDELVQFQVCVSFCLPLLLSNVRYINGSEWMTFTPEVAQMEHLFRRQNIAKLPSLPAPDELQTLVSDLSNINIPHWRH